MTSFELAKAAAKALDDKKGSNIKLIRIDKISTLGDYFVIASGSSSTQVRALADSVEEKLKEAGVSPVTVEGYHSNTWILVDYLSVVVHVFTKEAREFYDLDRLWSDGEEQTIDFAE